jgi:hypothetical protein
MTLRALVMIATLVAAPAAIALDLNLDLGVGERSGKGSAQAWSVLVCRPATEAQKVKIEAAQPGSKDRETLTWDRASNRSAGNVQELPLGERFRDLGKIWVQGTAEPKNNDVLMAVLYEGKPKRVYSFNQSEKHEVSVKDPDTNFDCPT